MKYCEKCGKEILDEAVICTNCGCAVNKGNTSAKTEKMTVPKKAKNSKIFGILSLLLLAPLGIPAIILANQSKKETDGVFCKEAKTGFICGIIGLSVWGLMLIINIL